MGDEDLRRIEREASLDPAAAARLRAEKARREKFERIVTVFPAYDRRGETPSGGVHGASLFFALRGPRGAVSLSIFTGWSLPAPPKDDFFGRTRAMHDPLPAGLDVHFPAPVSSFQEHPNCPWLGGAACWSDGSALHAHAFFDELVRAGSEGLWTKLEAEYLSYFEPVS